MRGTTRTVAVAGISALALLTAACNGGETPDPTSSGTNGTATGGEISVSGCTPQNPFIPAMTNETCGGALLNQVVAVLVRYNPETAAPELDLAEAIDTTDNQNFTVKLKPGRKFHDGTEVKAKNFVDAWNWNRDGVNGTLNSYFFDPIEGSADLDCGVFAEDQGTGETDPKAGDPDCEGQPPKAKTLTGLKVVDDYTFTIKTTEKVSNLPVRLGYTAFAPLPDSFFADNGAAFGKLPVGAGPYKFESYEQGTSMVVSKDPNYGGTFPGKADKITFKIYTDTEAAYKDVQAGQTDIIQSIPTSALQSEIYKKDLPNRHSERATGIILTLTFATSETDSSYDNPGLRKAISMAIDRQAIIDAVLAGEREPATGWVSPVVNGFKPDACGAPCSYDPTAAKAAFDAAGGYDGTITISYNADGNNKGWTEAACGSISDALGVKCLAVPLPNFGAFRSAIINQEMKGLYTTAWAMAYPSIENFLAPIYGTGSGSNTSRYSSAEFDRLLTEAASESDLASANSRYQQAETVLAADLPSIPMWYGKAIVGWSDRIDNVKITPFGTVDLGAVIIRS